jgi:hypothetical protein
MRAIESARYPGQGLRSDVNFLKESGKNLGDIPDLKISRNTRV